MAVLYKIHGWAEHFENNRTRELKHMDWVPMPNKMDGDGYTELVSHPDGAAHFGAWCAIVEVASKCRPRGTLLRDGQKPHDAHSLSRITRLPAVLFSAVIPRLCDMGWLEAEVVEDASDAQIPQEGAGIPQEGASLTRARRTERKGTEGNTPPYPPQAGGEGVAATPRRRSPKRDDAEGFPGFVRFWDEYPEHERKCNRTGCFRRWQRAGLEEVAEQVIEGVRRWKVSDTWKRGFVPLPLTWLNQERWKAPLGAPAEQASAEPENGHFVRRFDEEIARAAGLDWPPPDAPNGGEG